MSFSSFFDAEKISKQFIGPAVTVRKIHGRKVISFYRVASLLGKNRVQIWIQRKKLLWVIELFQIEVYFENYETFLEYF